MPRALTNGVLVLAAVILPLAGLFAWPLAVLGTVFVLGALLFGAVDAANRTACRECFARACHGRSSRK